MRILIGLLLILLSAKGLAQEIDNPFVEYIYETDSLTKRNFYLNAEEMPRFLDSKMTFDKFFIERFRYPSMDCIQTKIFISFVVETTGEITNKRIFKKLDCDISKEIMQVLDSIPKMKPGKIKGKPVPVLLRYPIIIELRK